MGTAGRTSLIEKRWHAVIAMAVTATVIIWVIEPSLVNRLEPVASLFGRFNQFVQWSIIAFLTIAFVLWNKWDSLGAQYGTRRDWDHPSTFVAVTASTCVVALIRLFEAGVRDVPTRHALLDDFYSLSGILLLLVCLRMLLDPLVRAYKARATDRPRPASLEEAPRALDVDATISRLKSDPEALIAWISNDDELSSMNDDVFGHREVAEKISGLLQEDQPGAIHLIGPLGSGKSTICNFVARQFEHDNRRKIVRISLWPYKDASSAVRAVLHKLVHELSKHVDTLGLAGLPASFVGMIEQQQGLLPALVRLAQVSNEPAELIDRLSETLQAIDVRFVLIVEDYERFLQLDSSTAEGQQSKLRAPELDALFYLLDNRKHISVILASIDLRTRFDSQKIARRVFEVPAIASWDVLDIVKNMRDYCLSGNPRPFINPGDDNCFDKIDSAAYSDELIGRFVKGDAQPPSVPDAFAMLCSTPRQLKTVLRDTWDAWRAVCGEVEWDSLALITCLKVCRPDVYAQLSDQGTQNVLRWGVINSASDLGRAVQHAQSFRGLQQVVDAARNSGDAARTSAPVWAILGYLYPETAHDPKGRSKPHTNHPQAISAKGSVNYFKVAVLRRSLPGVPQDQSVLSALVEWRKNDDAFFGTSLFNAAFRPRLLHFQGLLTPEHLFRLLREAGLNARLHAPASYHASDHSLPGIDVWIMLQARAPGTDWTKAHFEGLMADMLATNAILMYQLVSFTTTTTTTRSSYFDESSARHIQRRFLQEFAARARAKDGAAWLAEAVPLHYPWMLRHIDENFSDAGKQDDVFSRFWASVGPALLDLAEANPSQGLRYLLPLVGHVADGSTRSGDSGDWFRVVGAFDRDRCERCFQNNFDRLLRLLSQQVAPADFGKELCAISVAAQTAARNILGHGL